MTENLKAWLLSNLAARPHSTKLWNLMALNSSADKSLLKNHLESRTMEEDSRKVETSKTTALETTKANTPQLVLSLKPLPFSSVDFLTTQLKTALLITSAKSEKS